MRRREMRFGVHASTAFRCRKPIDCVRLVRLEIKWKRINGRETAEEMRRFRAAARKVDLQIQALARDEVYEPDVRRALERLDDRRNRAPICGDVSRLYHVARCDLRWYEHLGIDVSETLVDVARRIERMEHRGN